MEKALAAVAIGVIGLGAVIFFGLLSGIPVWLLWNAIIPQIFGLPEITFWQALGLSVLCALLFKSSGGSKD